jgi:hypothetical protein
VPAFGFFLGSEGVGDLRECRHDGEEDCCGEEGEWAHGASLYLPSDALAFPVVMNVRYSQSARRRLLVNLNWPTLLSMPPGENALFEIRLIRKQVPEN